MAVCALALQLRPGPSGCSWSFRISLTVSTWSTLPPHSDISFAWAQSATSTLARSLANTKQAALALLRSPAARSLLGLVSASGIPAGPRRPDHRPTSLEEKEEKESNGGREKGRSQRGSSGRADTCTGELAGQEGANQVVSNTVSFC